MSDLISRQAAIDAINQICPIDTEYDCMLLDIVDVRYVLSDLPSVQPEHGRWVPCSERLPDKEGMYLCTVGAPYRNPREMIYAPDNFLVDEDSNTWRSTDGHRVFNWFVIAWMPMPKPYEMDEEDK